MTIVDWGRSQLGSPYIFGAAGQKCTPTYRSAVMKSKPAYADAIKRNCPVLSGKAETCTNCRYNGKRAYDCRGLTRECIRAVTGRPIMGAGATSQWNDSSNWIEKGVIQNLPSHPCIVFVAKGSTMSHTGIYTGSSAIHAAGHNSGVIESEMPRSWTHYAIPVGLKEVDFVVDEFLLRRRDKGEKVKELQLGFMRAGYSLPRFGADGDFGSETEAALKRFQADHGLPEDGVWDAECQAALDERLDIKNEDKSYIDTLFGEFVTILDTAIDGLTKIRERLRG